MSTLLKRELEADGITHPVRMDYVKKSESLVAAHGRTIFGKLARDEIHAKYPGRVLVSGMRNAEMIELLRDSFEKVYVLFLKIDKETQITRLHERKKDMDAMDFDELLQLVEREEAPKGTIYSNLVDVEKSADLVIDNTGLLCNFKTVVGKVLASLS